MSFTVRFTEQAEEDLVRLYEYVLQRDPGDWSLAERALDAALLPLLPVLLSYVLSFIYVGIYWNKLQYARYPVQDCKM